MDKSASEAYDNSIAAPRRAGDGCWRDCGGAISLFAVIAAPLLLVEALLTFLGRRPKLQVEPSEALSVGAAVSQ